MLLLLFLKAFFKCGSLLEEMIESRMKGLDGDKTKQLRVTVMMALPPQMT